MKDLFTLALAFIPCSTTGFTLYQVANYQYIKSNQNSFVGSPHYAVRSKLFKIESNALMEPTKETYGNLTPSLFFLAGHILLGDLFFEIIEDPIFSIGGFALLSTTLAVAWDNLIIGVGKPLFGDAATNENTFKLLKNLSTPRFVAHSVCLPFLYTTVAEIGKGLGVEWLQSSDVQIGVVALSTMIAAASQYHFTKSEGITLSDTTTSPPKALDKSLVWFTYKKPDFFVNVVPAIAASLFSLSVGVSGLNGEHTDASIWMIISAIAVLYGSSKPSHVMRFTGNAGEITMLWSFFNAANILSS